MSGSGSPSGSIKDISRASVDSERSPNISVDSVAANGHRSTHNNGDTGEDADADPIDRLQRELERTREEKDTLATQYRNLLAKLTTMRTTLGNKLKQDAEELDRREQLVQQLTAQNDDLASTVETLKEELIASHEEADRAANELDSMRSRTLEENAQESLLRERELRETHTELERCRMEREEWERTALQERALVDDLRSSVETFKHELEMEQEARERELLELKSEREKSSNLQSVLQDFQAAKDHELKQAVKEYDSQLTGVTQSLAEFKHRALTAEVGAYDVAFASALLTRRQLQLEESTTNSSRTQELEKEVKEKNLLIGKLRHEAVIINEHLMEALRRLRRNSSDTNVDRRLVTNVLLSFLNTPRADAKRFEMLSLLATILSWTDPEREKAGLQRAQTVSAPSFWSRSSASNSPAKNVDLDKTDETESFSRLWVEFLLTEATSGESIATSAGSPPPRNNTSLPGTPTGASYPISLPKPNGGSAAAGPPAAGTRRLASYTSPSAMASSPNLVLMSQPSRKGKERDPGPP
ncbi:hypothetical protein DXG03_005946 [Asterophora parasitica]|uniref:GRIP domain-containing protein n=1 Tax=Asterophora parasitica TaxID=117018 RepID=A0A9P7FYZ7_9AGAR|nr:hypothetical protein DXG03_005946 [Asterophora parasitica]